VNILLVNYEYKGQGGGAGQQLYYMAKALRDMGHNITLLIGWDYRFGEPELLENVTTHVINCKRKNIQLASAFGLLSFALRGVFRINQITRKSKFDIIQFYFCVPTGILKYGIHGNIPYVVSLRGMDIPGLQKNKYKALTFLTSMLNKDIAKNAAAVLSNSKESADVYNKFAANIHAKTIPNAIDFDSYRTKTEYAKTVSRIVSVGRLVSWKRMDLLIDSVVHLKKQFPEIILDIYGQGYQYENLQQHIIQNNAQEYITLQGYINKESLKNSMREYDLFALLSTGDSSGNVFIEAMASGLPIFAAKAGGTTEIVEEDIIGILSAPDNLNDTVQKLEHCLTHPEKMAELGANGRKRVEEMFSLETAAQRHLDIYNGIITKKER